MKNYFIAFVIIVLSGIIFAIYIFPPAAAVDICGADGRIIAVSYDMVSEISRHISIESYDADGVLAAGFIISINNAAYLDVEFWRPDATYIDMEISL